MFKKNKELKLMTLFALGLSVIGVVFACVAMNVALDAKVPLRVWDVRFSDLMVEKKGTASAEQPKINVTSMNNFKVKLMRTDDRATYRFKIRNNGTVDARLKVISEINPTCLVTNKDSSSAACNDITYALTYNDGTVVSTDDVIKAGTSKEVMLMVEYFGNELTELEITDLDFILLFEQV